ncbi:TOBE domain-containing protein [Nocardioides anomalus]|uniref:TOBE domain-containing protein n=1 Tax=Nocardioides anomalus TaxID=2712223 RepID=A0A6G6W9X4_9ACTN|nr:TOBE domain-containing protein [Nocardioides anomalus]QIG41840.1 TOBE domain-containing protein [Nocardioides anomalus]
MSVEHLGIGEVAQALGVSIDTLRRWERNGRLTFERQGNRRVLRVDELRRLLDDGRPRHVSSAPNHWAGTVVAVHVDGLMAQVELACGDVRVTALMTRDSAEELHLRPGRSATAVVSAAHVTVEVDAPAVAP